MPTPTFFRLPEEKKQKILRAARKEYSRVPIGEVSIKNIVEEAGIPRGSFYAYFEGKEDLGDYLAEEYREKFSAYLRETFQHNQGSLFASMTQFYQDLLRQCMGENGTYLQMVFRSPGWGMDGNLMQYYQQRAFQKDAFERLIFSLVDPSNLRLEQEGDLKNIVELVILLFKNQLAKTVRYRLDYDTSCKQFSEKLEILRRGTG